jgi:competence protein ComEA
MCIRRGIMFYLSKPEKLVLLTLLGLLVAGAGLLVYARGRNATRLTGDPPIFVTAPPATRTESEIAVFVSGAVIRPGRYRMQQGATVADLIEAAGGWRPDAEVAPMDLRAVLTDGEHLVVRTKDGTTESGSVCLATADQQTPVSLNAATREELEALPGIGPVYAERIIAYREKSMRERGHGFLSVDELLNVRGIGAKRLAALRDKVVP